MAKTAIKAQRQDVFKTVARFVHIAGLTVPVEVLSEMGAPMSLIDDNSNRRSLEEQNPTLKSSMLESRENDTPVMFYKVAIDLDGPFKEYAFQSWNKKEQKFTVEPYVLFSWTGRCRNRAARELNAETGLSPNDADFVWLRGEVRRGTESQIAIKVLSENFDRKAYDIVAAAEYIVAAMDREVDMSAIAAKVGLSESEARRIAPIADLAPELKSAVTSGELPKTAAIDLGKNEKNHEKQVAIVEASKRENGKVSGKTVQENVKASKAGKTPRAPKKTPRRSEIMEMREALKASNPEVADVLHWVLTGERDAVDSLLLASGNEQEVQKPQNSQTTQTQKVEREPAGELNIETEGNVAYL